MIDYAKLAILASIVAIVFGSGWWIGHSKYVEYKASVEAIAKTQEAKVESIEAQHKLVTKGIQDEYDAKLTLLRQYYSNGVRQPSSSTMSNLSNTSSIADANTAYSILARQCSETTLMLTELQKWLNESIGIK